MRYRASELRTLTEAGVLAFVVVAAGATGLELGRLLSRALRRMLSVAESTQRPAVFLLRRDGKPVRVSLR